jgi:hypothetical protein
MQIKIHYESKYSLGTTENGKSFLTSVDSIKENENKEYKNFISENNSYVENLKEINKVYQNFKYNDITIDTILGILCRLVGDVRRLDDIKLIENHPIVKIKDKISFINNNSYYQNELINLHTPPKTSPNGAGGMIINQSPLMINNDFSENFFSIFNYRSEDELLIYIEKLLKKDTSIRFEKYIGEVSLLNLVRQMNLGEERFKGSDSNEKFSKLLGKKVYNIYGLLLYERINYLNYFKDYPEEIAQTLNKNGNIPGIATTSGGLTVKDFYSAYVKEKKTTWNLPYSIKTKRVFFKDGEKMNFNASLGVTKEGGNLVINLNVDNDVAQEIKTMIKEASVNTFYMGKKGLAYITEIKD